MNHTRNLNYSIPPHCFFNTINISTLNEHFIKASNISPSAPLLEQKEAYLQRLFEYFSHLTSSNDNFFRSQCAQLYLVWLLQNKDRCVLSKKRWTTGDSYSLDTHSVIKALRFFVTLYPHLSHKIMEISNVHPYIERSKYNVQGETIAFTPINGMLPQPILLATFHSTGNFPYLIYPTKKNQLSILTYVNVDIDNNPTPEQDYTSLDNSFKKGLITGDNKTYIERVKHYFTLKNHKTGRKKIIKNEIRNFANKLIKDKQNFCRQKRVFMDRFDGAANGYTNSYFELLRFFTEVIDVTGGSTNNKTLLNGLVQGELNRVIKNGYGKQFNSQYYVVITPSFSRKIATSSSRV